MFKVTCRFNNKPEVAFEVNQEWRGADAFWASRAAVQILRDLYEAVSVEVDVYGAKLNLKAPVVDPMAELGDIVRIGQPGGRYYEPRVAKFNEWKRKYVHTVWARHDVDYMYCQMVRSPENLMRNATDAVLLDVGKLAARDMAKITRKVSTEVRKPMVSLEASMTVIGVKNDPS